MVRLSETDLATVRTIARIMRRRGEFEELVGDGAIGLVKAALRYEEGRGATFKTFAEPHIVGAIIDGIRLRAGTKRVVPNPAPAAFVELNLQQLPAGEPSVLERLVAAEQGSVLRAAVDGLPARERQVLTLVYFHGLTQRAVARLFGCHESYVNHLKHAALAKLRLVLAK
jgi:RNA polymerase sigma factor (sigma-70 family)